MPDASSQEHLCSPMTHYPTTAKQIHTFDLEIEYLLLLLFAKEIRNRKYLVSVKIIDLNFVTFHKAESHLAKLDVG